MSEVLIITGGPLGAASLPVKGSTVSIGRDRTNTVCLPHSTFSNQHALIVRSKGKRLLCDLGSTNWTFLNDQPIKKHPLKTGDVVRVGEIVMRYDTGKSRDSENGLNQQRPLFV